MKLKMLGLLCCLNQNCLKLFQEKIKGLDKDIEEVHGYVHRVHMRLKDQDKLLT